MTKMRWDNRGGGGTHLVYLRPTKKKKKKKRKKGWVAITTKYPSTCIYCGTKLPKGTQVKWQQGTGVSCTRCQQ